MLAFLGTHACMTVNIPLQALKSNVCICFSSLGALRGFLRLPLFSRHVLHTFWCQPLVHARAITCTKFENAQIHKACTIEEVKRISESSGACILGYACAHDCLYSVASFEIRRLKSDVCTCFSSLGALRGFLRLPLFSPHVLHTFWCRPLAGHLPK